jgi:hypothetical protein
MCVDAGAAARLYRAMQPRIAERHAARASLVVLALVIALGSAMCLRVHHAMAVPGAKGAPADARKVAVAPPAAAR